MPVMSVTTSAQRKTSATGRPCTMDVNGLSLQQQIEMQIHHVPVKTGTVHTLLKNPPIHLKEASEFEPLYPPQEFILEETLRREAERVSATNGILGRVVYDAVNPSPYWQNGEAPPCKEDELPAYYV